MDTLLPSWEIPAAVNTPEAMTPCVLDVADVVTAWKFSVPETAGRAAAPAGTASHRAEAMAAAVVAAAMAKEMLRFTACPPE